MIKRAMAKNKRGLEFSFGWLFALIVGAAILFLAIYAAVKLVGTEREVSATETAKQLGIILTPVETGLEEEKSSAPIEFPSETRIYNNCTLKDNFGYQQISISSSLSIGKRWQEPSIPVKFSDKYIFSSAVSQGSKVYVFSKPFELPFKIADFLYLWTGKYCFVNPPESIEEDVKGLGLDLKNIDLNESINDCRKDSKKICFGLEVSGCDATVSISQKTVTKKGKIMDYANNEALLYAAIFADPEIYECHVQRVMRRASELAMVYSAKSEGVAVRAGGCSSDLQGDLQDYADKAREVKSSGDLGSIIWLSSNLENRNGDLKCMLWGE